MQISHRPGQRIVVIGTSCAGKSTFAAALGAKLGLPVVELDALYWGPGWTAASPEAFRASVERATAGDAWIAEGNYGAVRELLWSRAGTIIWLNYGFPLVLWRAVRRTVSRSLRGTELWNGNRETVRNVLASDSEIGRASCRERV